MRDSRRNDGVCIDCGIKLLGGRQCSACRGKARERGISERFRLKCEVIKAYGGQCACCGEKEVSFLVLDHINGGGGIHRKSMHSSAMYRWIRKNNFPNNLQVLCANCNTSKLVNRGVCVHENRANLPMLRAIK
jgi:hypothetical protein